MEAHPKETARDSGEAPAEAIAAVTEDLRRLRDGRGAPSYGELAARVIAQRMSRGMTEWEARVGRTTVYDVFRPGRRKLDAELVYDLALALGCDQPEAESWRARCSPVLEPAAAEPARSSPTTGSRPVISPGRAVIFATLCVALNLGGRLLVSATHLALFLDMVGTAVAAIILGPWAGAGVGTATSLIGMLVSGWISAPFIPVEVIGALLWGYGVRRAGLGRSIPRFIALNIMVAIVCSIVAVPIIVWIDGGYTGSGADQLTRSMDLVWHSLFAAVASQDLLTSLADKMISGFVALGVAEMLPADWGAGRPRLRVRSVWLQ